MAESTLTERLKIAVAWFNSLSPEQQAEHLRIQREGYVRSEMLWGDEGTRIGAAPPSPAKEGE